MDHTQEVVEVLLELAADLRPLELPVLLVLCYAEAQAVAGEDLLLQQLRTEQPGVTVECAAVVEVVVELE